jgi:alpha-L-arabinofuranosidase
MPTRTSRTSVLHAPTLFLLAILPTGIASSQDRPQSPQVVLTIDTANPVAKVSPMLYGLMTEEINFSYDGGLFPELIRNRTFQDSWMHAQHWGLVQNGNAIASAQIDHKTGPSGSLDYSMKLSVEKADTANTAGLENEGYWGIAVRPDTEYQCSFYAKSDNTFGGVTAQLINDDTGRVEASSLVPQLSDTWKKYELVLKTGPEVRSGGRNHFFLTVAKPGNVWFSLVSVFPPTYKNRRGGNRIDLMEQLAAIHPNFLRFPGGNYLEGDHINERFQWKKSIGAPVDRPTHPSPWGYQSSDGMGLLEFLEWCEDLGMQPVLAVYAGFSMKQEVVKPGEDLKSYVQDALDEIEYVTGSINSKWGAQRAKDGHPAPFSLKYVEIGNEDQFDKSGSYDGRYAQFDKAIKANYPDLQLIATDKITSVTPDVIDEHFYRRKEEFFGDVAHYDKTDRKGPKIFVGEWATITEGSPTPNFGAALGDAAWMTGIERNSDVVIMASYAPLFVNVNSGGSQWPTNLIGYDAMRSYGSPSYYAQVMFASHIGDEVLSGSITGNPTRFFYSVTRDSKRNRLFLKLVNATSIPVQLQIDLSTATKVKGEGTVTTLSALTNEATNSITDPTRILPVESKLKDIGAPFRHFIPGYAIQVIEIPLQ